jgi:hypothetical protein
MYNLDSSSIEWDPMVIPHILVLHKIRRENHFGMQSTKRTSLEISSPTKKFMARGADHTTRSGHHLGEFTPSYILHTRALGTYLLGGGLFTLQKRL